MVALKHLYYEPYFPDISTIMYDMRDFNISKLAFNISKLLAQNVKSEKIEDGKSYWVNAFKSININYFRN